MQMPMQMPMQMQGMMPQQPMQMPMQMQMQGMPPSAGMPGMSGVVQPGMIPGSGGPADMVRLIAEGGQYNGRVFDLPALNEVTVGRGVGNDLVLDDPSMSRKHSKLKRIGSGRLEVEDLNSANGTYVNGRKISTAQLGPGDTLRFGEVMFRLDGAGGSGARPAQANMGPMAIGTPSWLKGAFLGLAGVTALVWVIWLVKLAVPSKPEKGVVESAITAKIAEAEAKTHTAQEAFAKREWAKAKDATEAALELDPANLEAIRIRAQSVRAADDETKYKQGSTELEKGNPDGFNAAVRIFDSMSPDGSYRQEFADKLRTKLISGGEEFCRKKLYRECFETLCSAYRVSPVNQKPGMTTVKLIHEAERKAKISSPCILK
jgi:hypothetical protein